MSRWRSLRTRFLLVHLLLVAIPVFGVGFARFYEREMLRALEDDMIHQGTIIAEWLSARPEEPLASIEPVLRKVARRTRMRLRIFDASRAVVADSHREGPPEGRETPPPSVMPSTFQLAPSALAPAASAAGRSDSSPTLGQRAEITEAFAGRYGSATRLYVNGDRLFLFSALPVPKRDAVVYVTRSTNPVRAAMYRIRTRLFQISAIAFTATLLFSLFLAGTVSRPLARLTAAADAIAGGDRTRALPQTHRTDEIGRLARAFAAMRERLDGRARDTAELAANLSHEFKSPLTSLRGAAELLLDGAAEDRATREKFLRNMLSDTRRLDRQVTRLLELSRLEADAAPLEPIDLVKLARDVCAQRHDAPLDVVVRAAPKPCLGRVGQLQSALGNLVDNALQHAREGTRVTVTIDGTRDTTISVHNEGRPISEANRARIWDRFFTTRAGDGGSGLGLNIVKAAALAHGGDVSVESTGAGTTFSLRLPAA